MSNPTLAIGVDSRGKAFSLPLDFATRSIAIFGVRGAGKTNTASVLVEELLERNLPPVIIDPTDAWWGLRSEYPVFIFGGSHGDMPLAETDGKVVAQFVVTEQVPVILSLRHLRKGAQRRFVTDFCEEIYHLKGKDENRTALTVIIDECPVFVPQKVLGEVARTVGAVEDLIARGRSSGFGVVLISQRPATINKDVLTQSDAIVTHRITSPQDRAALKEWFDANTSSDKQKEILATLSALPAGKAWVWAPTLDIMEQVQVRKRRTYDSSATPKIGQVVAAPKKLTEVNLDQLKGKLADALAEAKANDPAALRQRIRQLEQEAKEKVAHPLKAVPERVEVPVFTDADRKEIEDLHFAILGARLSLDEFAGKVVKLSQQANEKIVAAQSVRKPMAQGATTYTPPKPAPRPSRPTAIANVGALDAPQQAILGVIAMLGVRGIDANRESVARWLDIHPNGGRYGSNLAHLRAEGYLDGFTLTDKGLDVAPEMATGFDACKKPLDGSQVEILDVLGEATRTAQHFTRETLAEKLGIHPNGGRYGSNLARLRTMGLIPERGDIYLTEAALR